MLAEVSEVTASAHDPLLVRVAFSYAHTFYPLGVAVTVRTNAPELLRVAEQSWGAWPALSTDRHVQIDIGVTASQQKLCPAAPAFRARGHLLTLVSDDENYVVADLRDGVAFGWVSSAAVQHALFLRYHLLEAVTMSLLCTKYFLAVHAACISKKGAGILLCGDSGAGKSTLSYACARAGWTFTSDDASYFDLNSSTLIAEGNSGRFRFRPDTRHLFPELARFAITPRAEGKPSVEIEAQYLPEVVSSPEANIVGIVQLNRGADGAAQLYRTESADVRPLLEATMCYPEQVMTRHRDVIERLLMLPCYRFEYDNLPCAIKALDGFAESFAYV